MVLNCANRSVSLGFAKSRILCQQFCQFTKNELLRGFGSQCIEQFGFRPHLTAGGPEAVLLAFHKLRMKEVGTGKRGSLTLSYPKAFIVPFKGQKVKM